MFVFTCLSGHIDHLRILEIVGLVFMILALPLILRAGYTVWTHSSTIEYESLTTGRSPLLGGNVVVADEAITDESAIGQGDEIVQKHAIPDTKNTWLLYIRSFIVLLFSMYPGFSKIIFATLQVCI